MDICIGISLRAYSRNKRPIELRRNAQHVRHSARSRRATCTDIRRNRRFYRVYVKTIRTALGMQISRAPLRRIARMHLNILTKIR